MTCDTSAPNPSTTPVQAAAGSNNVTVNVLSGAQLTVNGANAIGLFTSSIATNSGTLTISGNGSTGIYAEGNGNQLTNAAGGLIQTSSANVNAVAVIGNDNVLVNSGMITTQNGQSRGLAVLILNPGDSSDRNALTNNNSITTQGTQSHGMYVQSGNDSVFVNNGTITTNGGGARAIYSAGARALITNNGTLLTTGSNGGGSVNNTVYMQGSANHLINNGTIEARGANADGVFSNTAGSNFSALIENNSGAQIISALGPAIRTLNGPTTIINAGLISGLESIHGGNGNITFRLQTGSRVVGAANGGTGNNVVELEGTGRVDNPFTSFGTMRMNGSAWTWAGTGDFRDVFINSGALTLESNITGNMTIAAGTQLLAGNGFNPSIGPAPGAPPITVTNAGTIDLTNGGSPTANSLTINGNYVGQGGRLNLRTVLAGDGAASDRLMISGGTASGSTGISVANFNGGGAATLSDGIMLVQATNGGSTAAGAFSLNGGSVSAGAYEYYLFRGGVSAGSAQNWYLRSTLVAPLPSPDPSIPSTPAPEPAPGTPPLPPAPPPGSAPVPLYRPEVALYSAVSQVAREMGLAMLSTFHQRHGEQALVGTGTVTGTGLTLPTVWARVFGERTNLRWSGATLPQFDGRISGFQTGLQLLGFDHGGHRDVFGAFAGYARASGGVRGFATGFVGLPVGRLGLEMSSVGAYWTHIGPGGWYVDGVLMGSWYSGDQSSYRGMAAHTNGRGLTASIETGYPIALPGNLTLEPQAQFVWQRLQFDATRDTVSYITQKPVDAAMGRLGMRLQGQWNIGSALLMPYLRVGLRHDFRGTDMLVFDGVDAIPTRRGGTSAEVGGGFVLRMNKMVSAFATADYRGGGGGTYRRSYGGTIGLRVSW
ncbi:MAG TPA: autotransporter domain-containing protein [Beijerinckiaceae bacterium]|nr:autotransporter domain-containing protein [Beijerinckiaceae bacterium]